jgi:phenylacetate-CoA ligase
MKHSQKEFFRALNPLVFILKQKIRFQRSNLFQSYSSRRIYAMHRKNLRLTKAYTDVSHEGAQNPLIEPSNNLSLKTQFEKYVVNHRFWTSPIHKLHTSASTSGTTGVPLKFIRNIHDISLEEAFQRYWRETIGWKSTDKVAVLRGEMLEHFKEGHLWKKYHFNKRLYLNSYALDSGTILNFYYALKDFSPKVLYCYPTSALALAKGIHYLGLEPINIPIICYSSERMEPVEAGFLKEVFSGQTFGWYGNGERTVAAGQCSSGRYHFFWNYSDVEISEGGEIVSTPLQFTSYKVVSYVTDDLISEDFGVGCICGNSAREITSSQILGRKSEFLLRLDGTKITFLNTQITRNEPSVFESQIIQNENGDVELRISPDKQTDEVVSRLTQNFTDRVPELNFRVIQFAKLPKSSNGKVPSVINNFSVKLGSKDAT